MFVLESVDAAATAAYLGWTDKVLIGEDISAVPRTALVNDALGVPGFDEANDEVGVGDLLLVIELFLDSKYYLLIFINFNYNSIIIYDWNSFYLPLLDIFDKLFLLDKDLNGDDTSFFLSSYLSLCERTGDCKGVSYLNFKKKNLQYIN